MIEKRRIRDIASLMFRKRVTLSLVIIFDVLFILVLSSLRFVQISFDNVLFLLFVNGGKASLVYSFFYVILELFLIIWVYSFFKYFIVRFILEGFRKAEFKLKNFFSFLKLNLIIFVPLVVIVAVVLDLIIMFFNNWLSRGGIDPFMFVFVVLAMGVLALILFILVYTFINIVHFAFLKEKKIGKLLKKSVINSFRADSYRVYWNDFKVIIVFGVFMLIIHFFVKSFVFDDFSYYVGYYGIYKIFIYWMAALVIYFLLLFNRFNFYRDTNIYKKEV